MGGRSPERLRRNTCLCIRMLGGAESAGGGGECVICHCIAGSTRLLDPNPDIS